MLPVWLSVYEYLIICRILVVYAASDQGISDDFWTNSIDIIIYNPYMGSMNMSHPWLSKVTNISSTSIESNFVHQWA